MDLLLGLYSIFWAWGGGYMEGLCVVWGVFVWTWRRSMAIGGVREEAKGGGRVSWVFSCERESTPAFRIDNEEDWLE